MSLDIIRKLPPPIGWLSETIHLSLYIMYPYPCNTQGDGTRFTPSGVQSATDRTQVASDLASEAEAPFHSKQIRQSRYPRLVWSQTMVPNLCFRKRQPFFTHNFKRKSTRYSILSLQVASLSSAASCC